MSMHWKMAFCWDNDTFIIQISMVFLYPNVRIIHMKSISTAQIIILKQGKLNYLLNF